MVTDANFVVKKGLNVQDGDISIKGSNKELRFYEGSNYVGFEAPALTADKIWVLPAADGSTGQVLKTDGSGNLGWVTAGDVTLTGSQTLTNKIVQADDGSASAPSFSFDADTNTGMFRLTGDVLAFSVGGSAAMYMQSSKVEANKRFEIIAGSNSAPGLSLAGDDNTGIYRYAENQIGFTIDGTAQLFIKDGAIEPVTDNDIDLGTSSKEFKDGYFDGTLHCDVLDLAGTEYTSISGGISNVVEDTTPQLGGDLDVNGNKITSASNAAITIEPNGTGDINLYADTVVAGDASTDFKMQHRTKTNSMLKLLNSGNVQVNADANIYLNADEASGGGSLIRLNAITSQLGKSNTNAILTTQGTGDLTLSTNGGTNSGTIVIADGANANISLTPNGTGKVIIGSTVEFEGGAEVGEVTDVTIGSGTSGTTTGFRLGANQEAGMVAGEVSSQSTANDEYIELMNMDLDAITGSS